MTIPGYNGGEKFKVTIHLGLRKETAEGHWKNMYQVSTVKGKKRMVHRTNLNAQKEVDRREEFQLRLGQMIALVEKLREKKDDAEFQKV